MENKELSTVEMLSLVSDHPTCMLETAFLIIQKKKKEQEKSPKGRISASLGGFI